MKEEGLRTTNNELIHIGMPLEINEEVFQEQLKMLWQASQNNSDEIFELVADIVKTYHIAESHRTTAKV